MRRLVGRHAGLQDVNPGKLHMIEPHDQQYSGLSYRTGIHSVNVPPVAGHGAWEHDLHGLERHCAMRIEHVGVLVGSRKFLLPNSCVTCSMDFPVQQQMCAIPCKIPERCVSGACLKHILRDDHERSLEPRPTSKK